MTPLDPRLLGHAGPPVAAIITLGAINTGLVIAQALILATTLARAFDANTTGLATACTQLAAIAAARVATAWLLETAGHHAAATAKTRIRAQLLRHALTLGPAWLTTQRSTELATLATRGIGALDDYFAKYVPQLFLSVITPLAILAVITPTDHIAAITIAVTLPLIPIFMALIGLATQAATQRRWHTLNRLGHHFLDVTQGLATLKIFGRAAAQAHTIATITHSYRRATMKTLRLAFLSALALELLATLSVALVAVGIGLRLVHGDLTLHTALLILLLAPEAYLPLRAVGTHFHASADGIHAAQEAFAILDAPAPAPGTEAVPHPISLRVDALTITHPDREHPAPHNLTFTTTPGELIALTGESGSGKSTLLRALLGYTPTHAITVSGTPLEAIDPQTWREHIAWVPQHPHLAPGTVGDLLAGHKPEHIHAALRDAACDDINLDQPIGEEGTGLSAGQRRRLALARALLRNAPLLLLDEPTAGVDAEREAHIAATLLRLAHHGTTVLVATHRPALREAAHRTITLNQPALTP